jgi:hypothetical protein
MVLDSTVVCRRALGCEWGGINKDGTQLAQQESSGTSMAKERDMEAKASKHASKCEHACARARVCVCERVRVRVSARSLMATLPGGGPAEDGSELRSHACGVAKVEARGHAPGVGRIVIVTVTPSEVRP